MQELNKYNDDWIRKELSDIEASFDKDLVWKNIEKALDIERKSFWTSWKGRTFFIILGLILGLLTFYTLKEKTHNNLQKKKIANKSLELSNKNNYSGYASSKTQLPSTYLQNNDNRPKKDVISNGSTPDENRKKSMGARINQPNNTVEYTQNNVIWDVNSKMTLGHTNEQLHNNENPTFLPNTSHQYFTQDKLEPYISLAEKDISPNKIVTNETTIEKSPSLGFPKMEVVQIGKLYPMVRSAFPPFTFSVKPARLNQETFFIEGGIYAAYPVMTPHFESKKINDNWEKNVSPLISFALDISVGYHMTSRWQLMAGIQHRQIYQKFRFEIYDSKLEKTYLDTAYYIQNNGQKTFYGDSVFVKVERHLLKQSLQKQQSQNIFLGVGWSSNTKRFGWGIDAGLLFNLKYNFQGYYFVQENNPIKIQTNSPINMPEGVDFFKMNTGLFFRPYFQYQWKNNMAFTLNGRWTNQSIIWKKDNLSSLSIWEFGLGIKYGF